MIIKTKRKKKATKSKVRKTLWKDIHFVTIYQLACDGLTDRGISAALGVTGSTFDRWKRRRPAIKEALKRARKQSDGKGSGIALEEYIYKRLSPKLQDLWDKIHRFEKEHNGIRKIEALLDNAGKEARQYLFIHALIASCFNASEACRKVNISRSTVDRWTVNEIGFRELMEEMLYHQKEFCKGAYFQLVEYLEPTIVLHSARTLNRDFFGDEKQKIEVEGKIKHEHGLVISFEGLDISIEARQEILAALRRQQQLTIEAESKQIPSG